MAKATFGKAGAGLGAAVLFLALAGLALAGIDARSTRTKTGGHYVFGSRTLQASCWQEGQKIFEGGDFEGVSVGTLLNDRSFSLRRAGEEATSVLVVPLGRTVCIVTDR